MNHRYKESDEASRWLVALLIDDKRMLSQLLFECPVEEVRALFIFILISKESGGIIILIIMSAQIRTSFAELLASVVQTLLKDPLEQRALLQSVRCRNINLVSRRAAHRGVVCRGLPVRFGGGSRNTRWAT
jgi:hypothetical protein